MAAGLAAKNRRRQEKGETEKLKTEKIELADRDEIMNMAVSVRGQGKWDASKELVDQANEIGSRHGLKPINRELFEPSKQEMIDIINAKGGDSLNSKDMYGVSIFNEDRMTKAFGTDRLAGLAAAETAAPVAPVAPMPAAFGADTAPPVDVAPVAPEPQALAYGSPVNQAVEALAPGWMPPQPSMANAMGGMSAMAGPTQDGAAMMAQTPPPAPMPYKPPKTSLGVFETIFGQKDRDKKKKDMSELVDDTWGAYKTGYYGGDEGVAYAEAKKLAMEGQDVPADVFRRMAPKLGQEWVGAKTASTQAKTAEERVKAEYIPKTYLLSLNNLRYKRDIAYKKYQLDVHSQTAKEAAQQADLNLKSSAQDIARVALGFAEKRVDQQGRAITQDKVNALLSIGSDMLKLSQSQYMEDDTAAGYMRSGQGYIDQGLDLLNNPGGAPAYGPTVTFDAPGSPGVQSGGLPAIPQAGGGPSSSFNTGGERTEVQTRLDKWANTVPAGTPDVQAAIAKRKEQVRNAIQTEGSPEAAYNLLKGLGYNL